MFISQKKAKALLRSETKLPHEECDAWIRKLKKRPAGKRELVREEDVTALARTLTQPEPERVKGKVRISNKMAARIIATAA